MRYLRRFTASFVLFLSFLIKAEETRLEIWEISYKKHNFVYLEKEDILIFHKCVDLSDGPKIIPRCQEILNRIKLNTKKLPSLTGGKNPGAVFCKKILNKRVLFAKDKKGNVRTFCDLGGDIIIDNYWIMINHGKVHVK